MLELAALGLLNSDIEKSDAGVIDVHDALCIEAAHVAKLEKILWCALGIRAAVYEHEAVFVAREHRCHCRTANTVDALDDKRCTGEQCSR